MNVSTFMSLIWVLFGSNCDYYKNLQQIHKTLELKEVYALKASFTAENCRRITWAVLNDGRAFFDDIKTTTEFGHGQDMVFPQSYLIDILNNIRYAFPVERASFPGKWRRRNCTQDKRNTTKAGGGQWTRERSNAMQGGGSIGTTRQSGPATNTYGGQAYTDNLPRKGGSLRDWKAGWVDTRNNKIKALMDPYLERFNRCINLNKVLDAAGKRQTDLPTLPQFCHANGRTFLCWNST